MTDSVFDPTGGETEHSGDRNRGPSADNSSQMPADAIGRGSAAKPSDEPQDSREIKQIADAVRKRRKKF